MEMAGSLLCGTRLRVYSLLLLERFGVVEERPDCGWYCAGDGKEDGKWIVAVSTERELEGGELPEASLPPASEWEALKGSSVEWSTLERQARPVREMVNSTRGGVAIS